MAYIAMYRKYRPLKFEDMVGQENVTKILKNQILTGKIAHAYIFSGTRGTGKTSAAKIFARAINCLNPKGGEPCNECEACKSILDGRSTDVIEMDAASNNSVENIRSIRQEVQYMTTALKYKVYIIDEAHMLSTSAFNALLKTLEEPPENVVFILATTEEYKILPTILSRCIRFEFKKISKEDIKRRLDVVLKDMNFKVSDTAMNIIIELADGGMRDALSILERCITAAKDNNIDEKMVEEIIGIVPKELIIKIVAAILEYNVEMVDKIASQFITSGKDLRNISYKLTEEFLNVLIAVSTKNYNTLEEPLKEVAKTTNVTRLNEIIQKLSGLDEELRQSNNSYVIFKAKLLEITTTNYSLDENNLISKIKELEIKLNKFENTKECSKKEYFEKPKKEVKKETNDEKVETKSKEIKSTQKVVLEDTKKQLKEYNDIMNKAIEKDNLKLYSALTSSQAVVEQDKVIFLTDNSFAFTVLNSETSKEELKELIKETLNEEYNVKIEYIKEEKKAPNEFTSFLENSGMPYEIID